MVDIVYVPAFPPASPYEAYLYLLVIPLLLRLILVLPPLVDLVQKFSPDKKVIWQAVRSLKIRGLWVIVLNELLAIFLPFILALYARTLFDPLGWPDWEVTPMKGVYALIITAGLWLFVDFLRVARTRRLIRNVSERNRIVVRAAARGMIHARGTLGFLERFSLRGLLRKQLPEESSEGEAGADGEPAKKSMLGSLLGIGVEVGEKGLEVADAAVGVVRDKAAQITGSLDKKVEESIRHQSKIALTLMVRDLIMSLMPIVILVGLHNVW